ncbi:hypothetical protein V2J09_006795 [Rumex salicifolius]
MAGLKRRRDSTNRIGDSPEVCGGGRLSSTPLTSDYVSRPHKLPTRGEVCSSEGEGVDHSLQWRNLELSLTIESSKEDSPSKKVELVYNDLKLVAAEDINVLDEARQAGNVSLSRLVVRLSSWIQSLLISSEDKIRSRDKLLQFEGSKLCLDCRCWEILKYCLQESAKLGIPLSLSGNLLRVISFAFRNALNFLNDMSLHPKDYLELEGFKLYRNVYDCIRSMFSLHNGALKGSMDSWMAAVGSVLDLVTNIFAKKMESTEGGIFFIDLSCSVLEPFSKFLRVQRWRKNAFRDFVDNLLQPLFHLLGLLHDQSSIKNTPNLSNLIEEIISCGLFHPSHMDEFLKLQGLGKYTSSSGEGLREFKIEIRSYQRHLFEKLQDIVSQKKEWELSGTGELFQLFVKQVKNQKRELTVEGFKHMEGNSTNHMSLEPLLRTGVASEYNNLNSSTRKSTFDFLVQIMEPLLLEIKIYTQSDKGIDTSLLNARSILRSLNLMLYGVICEKIHVRTEDISEGACINFFKVIYDLIISFSAKVIGLLLSPCNSNEMEQKGILTIIAEELVVAVGYILEIEHKVIEEGLIDLWLMVLAFLAAGQCFNKRSEVCPLISRTIVLSCQVVNLFKELREASHAVFALCRGLRHLSFSESKADTNFSAIMSVTLLHNETISKSAELLMHSLKFRMNVHEALKKIPEGQASDCVHTLIDILKSLDWSKVGFSTTMKMKSGERNSHRLSVRAELLGKVFSEIYVLVLDSIPITAGNTCSVGEALNGLITFLKPIMSGLIASDGRVLPFMQSSSKSSMSNVCHWIILFLFRLSLSREVICLLPPRSSLKKSAVMGDAFTCYSGMDWMKSDEFGKEDYISCISQSSTSLLALVQSIRQNFDKASSADFCSLVYTLHPMIIQRLVDLNRQMIFVQYIMQENSNVSLGKVMADDGLALFDKKEKNWKLILSDLEEEASRLTAFMLKSLSLVDQEELLIARSCEEASDGSSPLNYYWDMCVCSLDEKTLPTAVWWIVCQNVAVWCSHANEEDTKIFLYLASNICHALQKFTSFPDWVKFLSTLKISYIDEEKGTISFLDNDMMEEFFKGRGLFPLTSFQFTVCQNLLNLLIHMPKRSLSNESFLLCTRFVLNLERVIVRGFMETHGSLQLHGQCELFRLLVSCRRALKCLIIAYSEERMNEESCDTGIFGECSTHVLWLLKSASLVVDRVNNCSNKGDVHANSMGIDTASEFMDSTFKKFLIAEGLKIAKLASHEMESSTKSSSSQLEGFAVYGVEELKARLRMSFKMLIKNSSHLGSVIQALEGALVGVQEGCTMIYDITIRKDNDGIVSSTVAAGIDCLDLVLESVEGRQPVKEKLQSLTSSLFNIVVHLQGPSVFYSNLIHNGKDNPDPGSVVLMCIEVLTRISRKDTLFQIDVGHQSSKKQKIDVGQFLRLPAAIFQDFCHLIAQKRSPAPNNWMSPATKASDVHLIDQQFSIDLYAACCRLLCTVVKHRHSECVKKTGLLQYSIAGLLNCLEMVDTDSVNRDSYSTWNMEEGIKCACYLRRVYEEIRQQKLFKEHCFKLLSNYISVYSGFGPLRKGIKREIDEAMRPGVYALIDACSEKNLQCLHTEFGEGPCRSILASLRHDYKRHFQYHGKAQRGPETHYILRQYVGVHVGAPDDVLSWRFKAINPGIELLGARMSLL